MLFQIRYDLIVANLLFSMCNSPIIAPQALLQHTYYTVDNIKQVTLKLYIQISVNL